MKIISKDEKTRMAYEAREAELMDQRTRITSALVKGEEIGIKKGKAEGKAEIIQAMLRGGMGIDEIASMTGMEMKEVEQIQKINSAKAGKQNADNPFSHSLAGWLVSIHASNFGL